VIGRPDLPRYGTTFAYGSNLDPDRIHAGDRCPDAKEVGHVQLEGQAFERSRAKHRALRAYLLDTNVVSELNRASFLIEHL